MIIYQLLQIFVDIQNQCLGLFLPRRIFICHLLLQIRVIDCWALAVALIYFDNFIVHFPVHLAVRCCWLHFCFNWRVEITRILVKIHFLLFMKLIGWYCLVYHLAVSIACYSLILLVLNGVAEMWAESIDGRCNRFLLWRLVWLHIFGSFSYCSHFWLPLALTLQKHLLILLFGRRSSLCLFRGKART